MSRKKKSGRPKKYSTKRLQTNFRLEPELLRKLKKLAKTWDHGHSTTQTQVIIDLISDARA